MRYRVLLSGRSLDQLSSIEEYIAEASSREIALRFVSGILQECFSLDSHPYRGAPRTLRGHTLRSISYRRRVSIFYRIKGEIIEILGIYYGGQDFKKDFQ